MGIEDFPDEDQLAAHRNDVIPPELSGQSSGMARAADHSVSDLPSGSRVTPCMRFCVLSVLILVILVSFASSSPLYAIMFALLAILPAGLVAKFILTKLKDDAVSERFLINQFLIGAIPLSIAIVFIQLFFSALLVAALFSKELSILATEFGDVNFTNGTAPANTTSDANTTTSGSSVPVSAGLNLVTIIPFQLTKLNHVPMRLNADRKSLQEELRKVTPLWKLILFLGLQAFLVAAFVEETGKWLVSRRYRKVNADESNTELGRTIGCSGVLAAYSMGALGFATAENLLYVLGLSATNRDGFPFGLVGLALLRSILAFPVHVGAQFYVGIAAAQYYIFHDRTRVFSALLVAIMLHGTFDGAAFLGGLFVAEKWLPQWTTALVVAFQLCLALLLTLLCRGRYKALLERERMVLPPHEDV